MANTIQIVITADNKASASISNVGKSLGELGGAGAKSVGILGKVGSALGGMATVAGGIIAANIFGKIASGLGSFVSTGIEAVGNAQQLEISLKALLTQNNMYEESVQTITQAVTEQVMSQDELINKQDELTAKLTTQQATYHEQEAIIQQLTASYGENGLKVLKAKAKHEELALAMEKTQRQIDGLVTTTTSYTTTSKTVTNQILSQADASKLAAKQTQELMQFISEVAVISPFETEDVELVTKYAVAAGLSTDKVKQFAPAFLDLAGAVGITSTELGFAADQLFQVKKVGQLTTIDLRQLRRLGIDLAKVLSVEMGMSVDEFNAKAKNTPEIFDELFDAVTRFSANTFKGTAQEMATSVKGLKSSLSDIFVIGARNFWRPIVEAVSPMASEIIGRLSDLVLGGDMSSIGQKLADTLMSGLSQAKALFNIAKTLGFGAAVATFAQMIKNAWPGIAAQLTQWGLMFWNFINDTVIPLANSVFTMLVNYIANLIATYWPIIKAQLQVWGNQFLSFINETVVPQIPTVLTELVQGITAWLQENWPAIGAALLEWSAKFWDWAKQAAAGAAGALMGVAAALVAWATSGEAQTAMNTLGVTLSQTILDSLAVGAQNQEGLLTVMTNLATGLLSLVGAIVGTLIIAGAQIVAGIVSGILQSLGIDLQPALFSELGTILSGIATNMLTAAAIIGLNIVQGIAQGILNTIGQLLTTLNQIGTIIIETVKGALGISSPSMIFMDIGIGIIQGLINGITSMLGSLPEIMGQIGSALAEAGAGLLSGLFGGGENMSIGFDPAILLEGLTGITTFLTETIPASVIALGEQFLLFFTLITEQIMILTAGALTLFITTLASIYLLHLPTLTNIWEISTQLMIASLTVVINTVVQLQSEIVTAQTLVIALAEAIVSNMEQAAEAFKKAGQRIKSDLIPAMEQARSVAESLAAALERVTSAAKAAGQANKGSGGPGFQEGTHGQWLRVPGGAGSPFPVTLHGGELFNVVPSGQGRPGNVSTVNNYFSQTINTRASQSPWEMQTNFRTAQLMMG